MSHDLEQLEHEVEAVIVRLGDALDVALPEGVLERTRLAARVDRHERWLEAEEASALSPALRARLRAAVRRELAGQPAPSARLAWWKRNVRGLSALGAAAMVGICIGVIHHAGRLSTSPSHTAADASFDQFVQTGDDAYDSDPLTADLGDEVQNLEQSIAQWPTETDRIEDGLQQIDEMIDGLQLDSTGESDTL